MNRCITSGALLLFALCNECVLCVVSLHSWSFIFLCFHTHTHTVCDRLFVSCVCCFWFDLFRSAPSVWFFHSIYLALVVSSCAVHMCPASVQHWIPTMVKSRLMFRNEKKKKKNLFFHNQIDDGKKRRKLLPFFF